SFSGQWWNCSLRRESGDGEDRVRRLETNPASLDRDAILKIPVQVGDRCTFIFRMADKISNLIDESLRPTWERLACMTFFAVAVALSRPQILAANSQKPSQARVDAARSSDEPIAYATLLFQQAQKDS